MSVPTTQGLVIETRRGADSLSLSLMLFMALNSIMLSLMPIVTEELREDFGFSSSQIGLLTSVFMLTFAIGAVPMGLAAARWGGRTLIFGAGLLAVGSILFAFTASYPWFLVARFLQGVGGSTAIPVSNALMAHSLNSRFHDRALGIFGSGHGLGVVVALLIMPGIYGAGGYRAMFLTAAGIAVVVGLIALAQKPVRARPSHDQEQVTFGRLMRGLAVVSVNRRLLMVVAVNIGVMAIIVGLLAWTPSFLQDMRGASLAVAAYLTAGIGVAQILGNVGGAMAMARWGKPFVLLVGMGVMFVSVALVPFLPGLALIFIAIVVAGFLTMAVFPAILGSVPEVVGRPEHVGPATGFLNMTNLVATLFAPWLFGVLLDAYGAKEGQVGYTWGYMLLALFTLFGTVAAAIYMRSRAKQRSA